MLGEHVKNTNNVLYVSETDMIIDLLRKIDKDADIKKEIEWCNNMRCEKVTYSIEKYGVRTAYSTYPDL